MKRLTIWIGILILLMSPFILGASTVKAGEKVYIDEPVQGNLYVAGGELRISAPINGDLVAAGGKIWVNSDIMDEGLIAGGELTFDAEVKGDLRVAGGKIMVNRNVHGDLVVFGGEIEVGPEATISGDLMVFGGQVRIKGTVQGKTYVGVGELTLDGVVNGGIEARGGKLHINGQVHGASQFSAEELGLGPEARFFNDVRYWQKGGEIDFGDKLSDGAKAAFDTSLKSEYQGIDREKWRQVKTLFSIYRFVAGILLILLLVSFFNRFFTRHAGKLTDQLAANFGYGLLYLTGVPILAFLALVTIIGIPVAFILVAGYSVSLALAGSLVATVLAYELKKYTGRDWGTGAMVLIAIGISLALRLLATIPVAGVLIMIFFVIIAFGALYQGIKDDRKMRRQKAAADPDIV